MDCIEIRDRLEKANILLRALKDAMSANEYFQKEIYTREIVSYFKGYATPVACIKELHIQKDITLKMSFDRKTKLEQEITNSLNYLTEGTPLRIAGISLSIEHQFGRKPRVSSTSLEVLL